MHLIQKASRFALGKQSIFRFFRHLSQSWLEFLHEFRRIDYTNTFGILYHEGIIFGSQKRVERNRNNPGFNRSPKQIEKFRRVLYNHQYSISGTHPHILENIARLINSLSQLFVSHFFAARCMNDDFVFSTFLQVAVNERNSHIKHLSKFNFGRVDAGIDRDCIVFHLSFF